MMDMLYFNNVGRLSSSKSLVQVAPRHSLLHESSRSRACFCSLLPLISLLLHPIPRMVFVMICCCCWRQIVHGTHDEVIPFSNGSDLHHACQKYHPLPPAWIDGATHNNLETVHSAAYMRAFRSFLQHLLSNPPPDPPPNKEGFLSWVDSFLPSTPNDRKAGSKDRASFFAKPFSQSNQSKLKNSTSAPPAQSDPTPSETIDSNEPPETNKSNVSSKATL